MYIFVSVFSEFFWACGCTKDADFKKVLALWVKEVNVDDRDHEGSGFESGAKNWNTSIMFFCEGLA
jgi:hypothetical protein